MSLLNNNNNKKGKKGEKKPKATAQNSKFIMKTPKGGAVTQKPHKAGGTRGS